MTDTTLVLNSGSGGTDLAGDDDATTGFHQYIKLKFGASNTFTNVTSSVGLPVNIVQDSLAGLTVNLGATDNAVLDQIDANTDFGAVVGGGVEATALRVTIASDSTGVLSVDDNGGSLTVDNSALTSLAAAINSNRVDVNIAANALNSSTIQDDAAFTLASSYVTAVGAIRDDSLSTLTAIEGDAVPLRVSSTGALHVTGGGGGTEYSEDVATPATIVGTATLMERDDALSTVTPIEGDWIGFRGTAEGALWTQDFNSDTMVTHLATLAGAVGGTEVQVDIVSGNVTNAGTFAVQVDGNALTALQLIDNPVVAHDAAASGSTGVFMAGAYATNSIEGITQVANADASHIITDLNGVIVTRPHTTLEEIIVEAISDTGGTSSAFTNFGAGGAGIHNYVTTFTAWNSSATAGYIDIRDGTAGTVIHRVPIPASGGSTLNFPVPLKQTTANTALAYDVSAALTTVYLSAIGFQAQG